MPPSQETETAPSFPSRTRRRRGVRGAAPVVGLTISGHSPVMDTRMLSPKQAAAHAGCGRTSIMRALSSGNLKALRDNEGNWQISLPELEDWMSMRRSPDRHYPAMTESRSAVIPVDTPETLARMAAAEARAEILAKQVEDLKQDRDRLAGMLEKSLESGTRGARGPLGWFDRLLGRT